MEKSGVEYFHSKLFISKLITKWNKSKYWKATKRIFFTVSSTRFRKSYITFVFVFENFLGILCCKTWAWPLNTEHASELDFFSIKCSGYPASVASSIAKSHSLCIFFMAVEGRTILLGQSDVRWFRSGKTLTFVMKIHGCSLSRNTYLLDFQTFPTQNPFSTYLSSLLGEIRIRTFHI